MNIQQEEPSRSAPTIAVHLWPVVSQLAWLRRARSGHRAREDTVPGLPVTALAWKRASRAEGGWAGSRRGWEWKLGKDRLGRVAERLKNCGEGQEADIPQQQLSVDERGLLGACNDPEKHGWAGFSPGGKDLHRKRLNGQGQRALKYLRILFVALNSN